MCKQRDLEQYLLDSALRIGVSRSLLELSFAFDGHLKKHVWKARLWTGGGVADCDYQTDADEPYYALRKLERAAGVPHFASDREAGQ